MAIAFDEFDYAETGSSATSVAVTNVIHDAGDLLVAVAAVFNSSGSTMTVSDRRTAPTASRLDRLSCRLPNHKGTYSISRTQRAGR